MKIKARVRREVGGQRPEEGLYRVRHVKSGLYLSGVADHTPAVRLSLAKKELGLVLPRRQAACVADTWIAVMGDLGVEIEPAFGD